MIWGGHKKTTNANRVGVIALKDAEPVFTEALGKERVVIPDAKLLEEFANAANENKGQSFNALVNDLAAKGAQEIIIGRGDARVYIERYSNPIRLIDYLDSLARHTADEIGKAAAQSPSSPGTRRR